MNKRNNIVPERLFLILLLFNCHFFPSLLINCKAHDKAKVFFNVFSMTWHFPPLEPNTSPDIVRP